MTVYTKRHGNQSWSCQDIFTEHLECKPHCGATGNAQDINKVKRIQPLGIMNVCKFFCANESIKIWRYFTESEDMLVVLDDIQGIAKVIRIHILGTMNACVKSSWQYIQELQIFESGSKWPTDGTAFPTLRHLQNVSEHLYQTCGQPHITPRMSFLNIWSPNPYHYWAASTLPRGAFHNGICSHSATRALVRCSNVEK